MINKAFYSTCEFLLHKMNIDSKGMENNPIAPGKYQNKLKYWGGAYNTIYYDKRGWSALANKCHNADMPIPYNAIEWMCLLHINA